MLLIVLDNGYLITFFRWDTLGEFTTSQPLPVLKVRLFTEATQFYQLDDKELGRVSKINFINQFAT